MFGRIAPCGVGVSPTKARSTCRRSRLPLPPLNAIDPAYTNHGRWATPAVYGSAATEATADPQCVGPVSLQLSGASSLIELALRLQRLGESVIGAALPVGCSPALSFASMASSTARKAASARGQSSASRKKLALAESRSRASS